MVSLFIILFLITLLGLIMEIAATALKLTGLDIHTARFQALSAITGTGFTTKETELLMQHRQRRQIIMALMVIGPICFLGMFSSFVFAGRQEFLVHQLLILLVFVVLLLLLTRSVRFLSFFHKLVERGLRRYRYPRRVQLEEVLQLNNEYGVYELKVSSHSAFAHKTLQEADLKERGFVVLAIERGHDLLAVPRAGDTILPDDILVMFGSAKGFKLLVHGDKQA